ncbi:hypothetical protein SAMN05192574_101386 [Mucilaginibacter gossypiicola]|uniref:Uncharacterized protein n=1 Tax=Mucilaginibacter gossypiicola TaxID=551995 RepID=A0A1H8A723_9SPHI|nr:hypothetical protein [Mucilaginibacter gossypiicola]SEM66363.1 hypothetical protein SAMN05192574_101386 [Mucilaginibacter gossypiicola]
MANRTEILFSEEVAYLPSVGAAVYTGSTARVGKRTPSSNTPAVAATSPQIFSLLNVQDVAYWGDNNMFPQDIIALAEKSTELPALLDWKARAAQGALVLPYERVYNAETKAWDEQPITDPDIMAFFLSENLKRYYREAYTDFYWFWNIFPDLIKNEEGDKIVYIGTHDASWCRWYKSDANGIINKMALASTWGNGIYDKNGPYGMELPVVNIYDWNLIENLQNNKAVKRFVYPVSYPSPGKAYYQLAPWDGIRTSGWLALASKIPVFKEAIMNNQMNIKYLVRIPTNYWPAVYPDWETYTQEEKTAKKRETLDLINKKLTGVENAGKSILNEVGYDVNGEKLPGWDIEVIEDKLKDGAYIEDSQEASAHLLRALGLDGTLVGQGPGRNLNAGGGSDKLIAFNMYVALLGPQRQVVDEPVYFACRYNGYYERHPFFFIKTIEAAPQALDTSRKVSTSVQQQWPAKDSSTAPAN